MLTSRFITALVFVTLSCLLPNNVMALRDDPPPFSISPSLNGLNVSYFTRQDRAKLVVYAVNHEKYPIICDAMYSSGPEKKNKRDQIIPPEKGAEFKFVYGRRGTSVLIQFMCIGADAQEAPKQTTENHQ